MSVARVHERAGYTTSSSAHLRVLCILCGEGVLRRVQSDKVEDQCS
jgi:hypothetical protein